MADTLQITVDIPIAALQGAINELVNAQFAKGSSYGQQKGNGYRLLEEMVGQAVALMDFSDIIKRYAEARVASVVDEVITAHLRTQVKARAKEMTRNGELLDRTP